MGEKTHQSSSLGWILDKRKRLRKRLRDQFGNGNPGVGARMFSGVRSVFQRAVSLTARYPQ
jgi:hypothetical protein